MSESLLSQIIFAPFFLSLVLFILPIRERSIVPQAVALMISFIPFLLTLILLLNYDSSGGIQFVHQGLEGWLGERADIKYCVGLDGHSMLLFLFTTIFFPMIIIATWDYVEGRSRHFYFFLLFLETAVLGIFASVDLFVFYLFWEAMLIPMYFLMGMWGKEKKVETANTFLLYMLTASLVMLLGIIYVGYLGGIQHGMLFTTDYQKLQGLSLSLETEILLFWLFAISFLVKAPMLPFHSWLPLAYENTNVGVVVGGILLKMATYALLRFNITLFPSASLEMAPFISAIAVAAILYGGIVAMTQQNLKLVIAYSSISHLGFLLLGLFALTEVSLQGALIQMVGHGLSTGALLFLIEMLERRRGSVLLSDFGGVKLKMPFLSFFFLFSVLASIGLPGLNGFVGEFLILTGAFYSQSLGTGVFSVVAAVGVILSAVYLLRVVRLVFYGVWRSDYQESMKDLNPREFVALVIPSLFMLWMGIAPNGFLNLSKEAMHRTAERVATAAYNRTAHSFKHQKANSAPHHPFVTQNGFTASGNETAPPDQRN